MLCIGQYNKLSKVPHLSRDVCSVQRQIESVLNKLKVKYIVFPHTSMSLANKSYNILWVRDIFINTPRGIQILKCDKKQRGDHHEMVQDFFETFSFDLKYTIFYPHTRSTIRIEAGDIIEYRNTLFIGLSKRTNRVGVNWFLHSSGVDKNKKVILISHNALHLDCVFNILPNQRTIVYCSSYIPRLNKQELMDSDCGIDAIVCVETLIADNRLNYNLSTNYLYVYPNHILLSYIPKFKLFYDYLEELQYTLHFIDFKGLERFGGSIRCFTQWISKPHRQRLC
tara:strand:- start:105 stop:950 length:846 start_codon:yes stop_codon:yes gene_type:complete